MDRSVELPVALPELRAVRTTTSSLHAKMKEHYGIGRIERGDSEWWASGRAWRSTPGCILIKQPGDVHRDIARRGPTTYITIALPSACLEGHDRAAVLSQLDADDPRAVPFRRLIDAVCARADRLELEVALAEVVGAFAAIGNPHPDVSRPVRRAIEYIRDHLDGSITLDDLAAHANLDKFHLCRAFRAQVGIPPHAYLTQFRIARAKQLLARGVRASDVAPLVGLYDQAQLTRHFRRIVGTTPARFAGKRSRA